MNNLFQWQVKHEKKPEFFQINLFNWGWATLSGTYENGKWICKWRGPFLYQYTEENHE